MLIFYYERPGITGWCFPCQDYVAASSYGSDCTWLVPGTFDDEGNG